MVTRLISRLLCIGLFASGLLLSTTVSAGCSDRCTLSLGASVIDPASPSDITSLFGDPLKIKTSGGTVASVSFEYFVRDRLGVELNLVGPYKPHFDIPQLGRVGSSESIPATLSAQYHFGDDNKVTPFLGLGVSYSRFYNVRTEGTEAGGRAEFDSAFGAALHAGVDFDVGARGAIRLDARWTDMDTTLTFEGVRLGVVQIDPLQYGAAYVLKF